MHFRVNRRLVARQLGEHVNLPQRPRAIERLGVHPAADALQRLAIAGRWDRRLIDVTKDVEILIFDPTRTVDVERRLRELVLQALREMEALREQLDHVPEEIALVTVG